MRQFFVGVLMTGILGAILLAGCAGSPESAVAAPYTSAAEIETTATAESEKAAETGTEIKMETETESETDTDTDTEDKSQPILLSVNGTKLEVTWEDNESVRALREALQNGDITVETHQYGGFEQVGSLPQAFVRNDVQMRTAPGDIVLYGGDSVVLFYGSNSWAYTKLGHIENLSADELRALLSGESVIVKMYF